jgi:hypothetical protein
MQPIKRIAPTLIVILGLAALLYHGPIAQPADYHAFADTRSLLSLPNALDVLSNVGFLLAGAWGLWSLKSIPDNLASSITRPAYFAFMVALMLTALGSGYYHLAPDNARLVWDRLPIALACAALLVGGFAETHRQVHKFALPVMLLVAVVSVIWWAVSERLGVGDLRPYLALQAAPLILIPLWQWANGKPTRDRAAFGCAVLLYVFAKLAELNDAQLHALLGLVSGHTLKHILASLAALVLTAEMLRKLQNPQPAAR